MEWPSSLRLGHSSIAELENREATDPIRVVAKLARGITSSISPCSDGFSLLLSYYRRLYSLVAREPCHSFSRPQLYTIIMRFSPIFALAVGKVAMADYGLAADYGFRPEITCPPPTSSKTITRTTTATISACPIPEIEKIKIKIICYGNHCAPEHPCDECERYRVVCDSDKCHPEVCHDKDNWDRLTLCHGDDCYYSRCKADECNRRIICVDGECAREKCAGDECKKKFVCHGHGCKFEKCDGDDCFKKHYCDGKECKPEPYDGHLPVPPPPHKPGSEEDYGKDHDHGGGNGAGQPGSRPPGDNESPPIVLAGSGRTTVAFNLLGAALGLLFLL